MPVKKKASKKKTGAKRRGDSSGGSTVSHAALVAHVRILTRWIKALKVANNFGGWTIEQIEAGQKPDPGGGPPGI